MNWYVLTEDFELEPLGYHDLYISAYQKVLDEGTPFVDVVSDHQVENWMRVYEESKNSLSVYEYLEEAYSELR